MDSPLHAGATDDDYYAAVASVYTKEYRKSQSFTFKADKYYIFVGLINKPGLGYGFAINCGVTVNGNKGNLITPILGSGQTLVYYFGKPITVTKINDVAVNLVSRPVAGEKFIFYYSIPSGDGYDKNPDSDGDDGYWSETDTAPSSWNDVLNGRLYYKSRTSTETFNANKYYTFVARIKSSSESYEFSSTLASIINAYSAKNYLYSNTDSRIWYCFGKPATAISSIVISEVFTPIVGDTASTNWAIPSGAKYSKYNVTDNGIWYETSKTPSTYNDVKAGKKFTGQFKADKYYTFVAQVGGAESGYGFANKPTATISGHTAQVETFINTGPDVWYCFGTPRSYGVGGVTVSGVKAPIVGEKLSFDWTIPTGYGYVKSVDDDGDDCYWVETDKLPTDWHDVQNGIRYYKSTDSTYTFKSGKYYTFVALTKPVNVSYGFISDVKGTINGKNANVYLGSYNGLSVGYSFGEAKTVIKDIKITDVVAPVVGETASLNWSIPLGKGYSKWVNGSGNTGCWYETDDVSFDYSDLSYEPIFEGEFKADKYYTFVAWIDEAKDGYVFDEGLTATINGNKANVKTYSNYGPDIWYCFGKPLTPINDISITGVAVPVAGEKAKYGYSIPTGKGYSKMTGEGLFVSTWVELNSPFTGTTANKLVEMLMKISPEYVKQNGTSFTFKADKSYLLIVGVKPQPGYTFSKDLKAKINGQNGIPIPMSDGAYAIAYCFGKPLTPINDISITGVTVPVVGETASLNWVIPLGKGYSKWVNGSGNTSGWYETDGVPFDYSDVENGSVFGGEFKADKYYTFVAWLDKAKDGYVFDEGLTATINGNKANVKTYSNYGPDIWYCFGNPLPKYNITVTDGKAKDSKGNVITSAVSGSAITITANEPANGKIFDKWQVTSGGVTIASITSKTTTFTMKNNAVSIKATYKNHTHTPNTAVKENIIPATCSKVGSYDEVVYCKECTAEISRTAKTVAKISHTANTAVKENNIPATCSKVGSYDEVIYCKVCKAEISRTAKTVAKISHTANTAVKENNIPATCTKSGSYDEVIYCKVCKAEISRTAKTVPVASHSAKIVKAVAPTCTTDGLKEGSVCDLCGKVLKEQTTVKATGHIDSNNDGKCDNCSADMSQGKLGDVSGDGKINTKDAKAILRFAAKLESFTDAQKNLADVNKDGKVNTKDAKEILKFAAKLDSVLK